METVETKLEGPLLIKPTVHRDGRGFFCETYRQERFRALGIAEELVQDNHSRSREGVVRGMHFQIGTGVAKVVRCARGAIYDVVVDLRAGSPTFGRWEAFQLDEENMYMLYCPVGFAHGFCTLSTVADVLYKQSAYYNPEQERAIAFDDPEVGIEWPFPPERLVVSRRDATAPRLAQIANTLPFRYNP